ncbi:hypothetical protein SAMN05660473_00717 [Arthrobacter sp. 49Tsu3.1M3]|uniref:hypothetical protein n=1 Tax=Arthrobacter sp. 49Tsu3.1M3 TaxID=1279029 RepID=UPI0009A7E329|nr:hypothetical protein [Arthrobacter sp. 49Tsu3.1M3]SKB44172.1 hypothetical protein SAMN05660473_00717 [Arthrobacter sp. 49Tsu3.1M3]
MLETKVLETHPIVASHRNKANEIQSAPAPLRQGPGQRVERISGQGSDAIDFDDEDGPQVTTTVNPVIWKYEDEPLADLTDSDPEGTFKGHFDMSTTSSSALACPSQALHC